jgi:hypothetical protein
VKSLARFLSSIALALLLTSCSGSFDLRPSGHIGNVTFLFFKSSQETKPFRLRLADVWVQRRSGSEWKLIWVLRGDRHIDAVTYGHEYPGLHAEKGPERLVVGGRYRVGASGGGLYGGAEFTLDSRGNVVVVPPTI